MNFSSKLIEQAVEAFAGLPGIGKKTALRLVLHLISKDKEGVADFTKSITDLRNGIQACGQCHNLSDDKVCVICEDKRRDQDVICVVEGIRDVMAIENTGQYRGLYHVLGGVIRPIEGVGPEQLNILSLVERAKAKRPKEIVMAISPTIEGETTVFYIAKQLKGLDVRISSIARGVAFGGELQYADELTLGRAIAARRPYAQ